MRICNGSMVWRAARTVAAILPVLWLGACAAPPAVRVISVEPPPAQTLPVASPSAATVAPVTTAPSVTESTTPSTASLSSRIDALINQSRFRHATWGIDVVDLASGQSRYTHRAQEFFTPASNTKLFTAALALHTFGGDARFHTTLYTTAASRAGGVLDGDLILHGGGDPALGDARVQAGNVDWARHLADGLAELGITRVEGDLIADDTYFQGHGYGSGWEVDDLQASYAARASALSHAGNVIRVEVRRQGQACCRVSLQPRHLPLRVLNLTSATAGEPLDVGRAPGSDTIHVRGNLPAGATERQIRLAAPDPARAAAYQLAEALSQRGIQLAGRVRTVHWPETSAVTPRARVLARMASPPLRELLRHMLKHSDNLYAQVLLQDVGVETRRRGSCPDRSTAPASSEDWGLCAMRAMLGRIGIADQAHFTEGSGLSRQDLVTPAATTSLLMWAGRQPFATDFRAALPVAGIDGTLQRRLKGTLADGNLSAKTGTLTHVYALSGYVADANGKPLAFSIYLNNYRRPRDSLGRALPPSPHIDIDAVAEEIAAPASP